MIAAFEKQLGLDSEEAQNKLFLIRHTTAHVLALAVLKKFPTAKIAIGPPISQGFYYDFDLPESLSDSDFAELEASMRTIISARHEITRRVLTRAEAMEFFADQAYKLELIRDLPDSEEISTYTVDSFTDLCRGPHVASTASINPQGFKLLRTAGAYWRGDSTRPMLTRIYGTAWENPKQLRQYLEQLKKVEKSDHRRLGSELGLFHIEDENPGQVFWHPAGWNIYLTIQNYIREKISAPPQNYVEVHTPQVMPKSLWERSGHWAKYQENMFITESEKREFALKPMNCPGHIEIFKKGLKSYRDLPLRMAEFGSCTRNEASGALHGLMRVRGFVQDDAHIFCTEEQIAGEVKLFFDLLVDVYADFGFSRDSIIVQFSTRPEKRIGSNETWDNAEAALESACRQAGLEYTTAEGEGAFYGPKLDVSLVDALGRQWQCGTMQVDYQLPSPERLNAQYTGEDGALHAPVILHRAVLGSIERFIGILIEHYSGALPLWLSTRQVVVIPVAASFNGVAQGYAEALREAGIRAAADTGTARMNAKIRKHQQEKIPYMLIVGEKEATSKTVSVRTRSAEQHSDIALSQCIENMKQEIAQKGRK